MFVALFAGMIILFYVLYSNPLLDRIIFIPLANFYALISGKVLAVFGYTNMVVGDIISSPSYFSVSVKKGCDAAEPMAIFISGILAFRSRFRQKLIGLAIGLPVMFALNIIRVVTLYMFGIHFPELFETMHLAIWQVAFILVAIALWYLWLQKVVFKQVSA